MNSTYKHFQEKQQFFVSKANSTCCGMKKVDTWAQLETLIQQFRSNDNLIFRGMKEAEYKILSQLQVQWNGLNAGLCPTFYHQYVIRCIEQLKKEKSFLDFLIQNGINQNDADFFALSILQHYGHPTPLIDFTDNFDVALFFMTDGLLLPNKSSNDIKHYSSIYVVDKNHPYWVSYNEMIKNAIAKGDEMLDDWMKNNPDCTNVTRDTINGYSEVSENGTGLIIERGLTQYSSKYFGSTTIGSNSPRQNMQSGLFVLNTSVEQSLEEHMKNWYNAPLVECYNVNKNLCGQIKNYLEKKQITKDSVYLRNVINSDIYSKMIELSDIISLKDYLRSLHLIW